MKRPEEIKRRTELLARNFEHYLLAFDENPAFRKPEQLQKHVATIKKRRELGSASAAATDIRFLSLLYETLNAWGIGQRGSKLPPFSEVGGAVGACASAIPDLDGMVLEDSTLDVDGVAQKTWNLIESFDIVANETKLVPCTKALHHLLPDLIVPMHREFTRTFFGWNVPEFQYKQKKIFHHAFRPSRFVGSGRRTSSTKVIDNALVAFCRVECLPIPS